MRRARRCQGAQGCSRLVRRVGKDPRHVAHLAAGADFELAVEMQAEVGLGEDVAPFARRPRR